MIFLNPLPDYKINPFANRFSDKSWRGRHVARIRNRVKQFFFAAMNHFDLILLGFGVSSNSTIRLKQSPTGKDRDTPTGYL